MKRATRMDSPKRARTRANAKTGTPAIDAQTRQPFAADTRTHAVGGLSASTIEVNPNGSVRYVGGR